MSAQASDQAAAGHLRPHIASSGAGDIRFAAAVKSIFFQSMKLPDNHTRSTAQPLWDSFFLIT